MIFIWGSRLYGKSEQVKGMWHVATRFGHLWFIPLFPVSGSFVVLGGEQGVSIPICGKSVLATYLRGWGIPLAMVLGIVGVAGIAAQQIASGIGFLAAGLVALGAMIWSYTPGSWFMRCSPERAREIASKLGLNDAEKLVVELATGAIDHATFDKALQDLERDLDEMAELAPERAAPPTRPVPPLQSSR